MEITYSTVRKLLEKYPDHIRDVANEYGEPGYGNHYTTGVLVGDWWCRCGEVLKEDGSRELHDLAHHYPRTFAALEESGWEMEWEDEWVVTYDGQTSRAYRTQPDSYSWQSSVMLTEGGEYLTPEDDVEEWVAEVVDEPHRALTSRVWSVGDLERAGFRVWDDGELYESGWHPGQTDDPEEITRRIRETLGDDVEIVFHIAGVGQFDVTFRAMVRGGEDGIKVPTDHPVQPLRTDAQKEAARSLATCGVCGLSWDDGVTTSITPAPSARCPFEEYHEDEDEDEDEDGDKWTHDPSRDGAGCSWCGAWAMVNADCLCEECYEDEDRDEAHGG